MELITPNWKVPAHIRAYSTTRLGGVSKGAYAGLNLGMHVSDDHKKVEQNRRLVYQQAHLPSQQVWLNQTHSNIVVELKDSISDVLDADGSITSSKGVICTVMTADCLPVLLTDGEKVAAVHAGWRGLAEGIVENAVRQFSHPVTAWLGPAIGANAFEVGQDVFEAFTAHSAIAEQAFRCQNNGKYLADMNLLATQRLNDVGVESIYYSQRCTFEEPDYFYSYRRDGVTGRQATFIWIE